MGSWEQYSSGYHTIQILLRCTHLCTCGKTCPHVHLFGSITSVLGPLDAKRFDTLETILYEGNYGKTEREV